MDSYFLFEFYLYSILGFFWNLTALLFFFYRSEDWLQVEWMVPIKFVHWQIPLDLVFGDLWVEYAEVGLWFTVW